MVVCGNNGSQFRGDIADSVPGVVCQAENGVILK